MLGFVDIRISPGIDRPLSDRPHAPRLRQEQCPILERPKSILSFPKVSAAAAVLGCAQGLGRAIHGRSSTTCRRRDACPPTISITPAGPVRPRNIALRGGPNA